MKYRVDHGNHTECGVRYTQGSTLESEYPLDEIFANKFSRIDEETGEAQAPEEDPKPKRRRVRTQSKETVTTTTPSLEPKHKGGGKWVVLNKETGEQVNDNYLSKKEAYELAGVEA